MIRTTGDDRRFLFLQGPHGPFFRELGAMLRQAGAEVWRVGFNRGDQAYWGREGYLPFTGTQDDWPAYFDGQLEALGITDLVLYGDTRFIHAEAVRRAKARGIRVHVFEEGYLRPWWVTYERGGSNGHSRLMDLSVAQMQKALETVETDLIDAPAHWGDMRQHVWYGAAYHARILLANRAYRGFRPHRALNVGQEFRLHLGRLLAMPFHAIERRLATRRVRLGGFPYHLALLQLEHDSSFQQHSPFSTMTEFLELAIRGFAEGAPRHHHLVFKAHPLEDGRTKLKADIARLAREAGVAHRVHFIRGGKLAGLLNHARSAVTVNSTAAQQVLWRGMPLKVFGAAVYDKPEFVSTQDLPEFFAQPTRPDLRAYRDYRRFLLESSQLPGGFYSAAGRRQLLRQVVDMILSPEDPYDALIAGSAAPRQHLRLLP
ncbi:capsule biosynthesis protein [Pararhodobacter sp. CCB-MM2]|uniref:capsule biosynthesis protein n=1 Tax=Pararhodobacter sp. CCB-MM2 TaxID=1786003 RepID=UPI00082DB0FC|nr:capsular biosynthesis protein [Pararhodobacter sp. CCB-MM2]